jgi:magnesium transporter
VDTAAEPVPVEPVSFSVTVVDMDFASKTERTIALPQVSASMDAGRFVWIDVAAPDAEEGRRLLRSIGLLDEEVIDAAFRGEPAMQYARFEPYLLLTLSGYRRQGDQIELERACVVIAEKFLVTIRRGPVAFLNAVRRDYRSDFVRFAKTPSFLVYEIWDHLMENYLAVQNLMGERVERLQNELNSGNVDDKVFLRISELGSDLLHFRKVLLPARAVLKDLSTRRSMFLSEATQGFLANMVGTVEHLIQDMLVDRDILSESVDLYMSVISHRTNQVMKRLTIVSVLFLPLTFLVGVYGMNFRVLPELEWHYGYLYFWLLAGVTVTLILVLMRRGKML